MKMTISTQSWPINGAFTISRGSKTHADVVVVTLEQQGYVGRGNVFLMRAMASRLNK